MNFDAKTLNKRDSYRLLTGGITPRPIAWISTQSKQGVDNLAPYSFFTVASCNPPVLLYTQVTQSNLLEKDTLQNLKDTKECVVHIVNESLMEVMNQTSESLASEECEFESAGIKKVASHRVTPFSVAQSLIRYECTLRELILVSELPSGGTIALLDVCSIYVKDDLLTESGVNDRLLDTVGKMGGNGYSRTRDYVELERP